MRKSLLLLLMLYLSLSPVFAQIELDLKPAKRPLLLLNKEFPMIYKPTKLIIGRDNKFVIKAEPGSYVTLSISSSNEGANTAQDPKVKSEECKTIEGVVPANGLLELNYTLPDNKDLNEKTMYIKALISKDKNYTDAQLAKIIAPSGRETENNGIIVNLPPDNGKKPTFVPSMPGAPIEMFETMKYIEKMKKGGKEDNKKDNDEESFKNYDNYYNNPVMLRNLKAPELENNK